MFWDGFMGVLMERLIEVTEEKISMEQGEFMKGKGSMEQIFTIKIIVEEYLGKDLEKVYDMEALEFSENL